jgi:8-oxo-dGTP pyrophosphatase MutT (NUDIX family)
MKDPTRWQEILIQSGSDKLTKQDVYDYYTNPKIQKHLLNATGKNEVILRQSFTPENVVLRRKSESGAPIFLRGKSDLQTWAEKRLTEVHPTYGHKTDHLLVDLDPGEDVSWTKVQQTAKQVAQTLGADPSVTGVSAQFSGHRGFYVRGQLDRDMNIDAAREKVKGLLAGLTQQDKSLTLGIKSDPQRQIRLDTTPLKYRGSVKAPYSLSAETGLVAAPVQIDDLTKVKPGDFTIGQIVKTAIDLEGLRSTCLKVKEAAEFLSKEARLSMSKLQGMLKGEPALFHMVNPENVPNFLQSKKLLSPLEAKTRGLVSNLEGGAGVERVPTSEFNKTRTPIRLGEHSARIDARNLVSGNSEPAAQLTRMSAPGVTGKYHRVMQENRNMSGSGAGKNWSSISFDTVPRRAYGDVGMMTSPSQIRGSLVGESYTRGPRTPESLTEVQAHPSWVSRKGLTHHMTLPQATGNIVYDPQAVSREAAKQLKAQGGVPLNARFRRLSKAYQKQNLQNMPAGALQDIEAGNVNTATTMPQWHQKTVARAAQRVPLRKSWKKPTPIEQVKTSAAKLYRDRVEVFARTPDGKILAGLYSGSAKNVAVPGGGIEKGETKAQAGKREFREEAGIAVRRIRELGVAPVLTAWAKKDKSYKGKDWQADIKKHPKGNRTHFVLADIDTAKPKQKPRDPTEFHKTLKARPINDLIEIQRKAIQSHSGSDRLKQMRKRLEMLLKIKHAEKTAFDYGGLFRVADVLDDQLWLYLLKKHQQAKETPVEAPSYSMTPGPGPANYAAPPPFAEEPRSMFRKESAQKEFAPGIPLSRKIHDVPKVRDKAWTLAVQRHFADKAGKHFDLRLVDPSTGRAHSFAMPKAELPKPGQMRLAIQQATHTSDYALNFEGKIPKGTYGSGKVEMALKKPVDIIKANANKILFKTKDGDSYSMFRMKDKNWGIRNTTK